MSSLHRAPPPRSLAALVLTLLRVYPSQTPDLRLNPRSRSDLRPDPRSVRLKRSPSLLAQSSSSLSSIGRSPRPLSLSPLSSSRFSSRTGAVVVPHHARQRRPRMPFEIVDVHQRGHFRTGATELGSTGRASYRADLRAQRLRKDPPPLSSVDAPCDAASNGANRGTIRLIFSRRRSSAIQAGIYRSTQARD